MYTTTMTISTRDDDQDSTDEGREGKSREGGVMTGWLAERHFPTLRDEDI